MRQLIFIFCFLLTTLSFSQNEALFEKGNALYNEGKYAEAVDAYKAILASKNHSAALYFNLGNAYYKLNDVAPSIYYYEKALQLSPNDSDIRNNLAFARNMTIDSIDTIPEAGFSKLIKIVANYMSFDGWAKLAVSFSICFVLLFLIYYFAYSSLRKRMAFIGSIASLFILIVALVFAFHKFNIDKKDRPAIVFAQETKVKAEPNLRSEESFRLHEGTKVQILDTVKSWKKIKLADGKTGWVSQEDIKPL